MIEYPLRGNEATVCPSTITHSSHLYGPWLTESGPWPKVILDLWCSCIIEKSMLFVLGTLDSHLMVFTHFQAYRRSHSDSCSCYYYRYSQINLICWLSTPRSSSSTIHSGGILSGIGLISPTRMGPLLWGSKQQWWYSFQVLIQSADKQPPANWMSKWVLLAFLVIFRLFSALTCLADFEFKLAEGIFSSYVS